MLENTLGKEAQIEYHPRHRADMLTNHADISKARAVLNWEPQISLEEGVQKLVDWYLAERDWAKEIFTE